VFGDAIRQVRPDLFKRPHPPTLSEMKIKVRGTEDSTTDLRVDCQVTAARPARTRRTGSCVVQCSARPPPLACDASMLARRGGGLMVVSWARGRQVGMNSPLKTASPLGVRGPHHDALAEIWGGLFYLKHDDDQSDGAALQGACHVPIRCCLCASHVLYCMLRASRPRLRASLCELPCFHLQCGAPKVELQHRFHGLGFCPSKRRLDFERASGVEHSETEVG
jgi:hypothetical protein